MSKSMQRSPRKDKGFTLISAAVSCVAVIGTTGLAVDLGRMFIAKNELQSFVDAAVLAAATELNGTDAGIASARTAALNVTNRWNFGTQTITNTTVEFSRPDPAGGLNFTWLATPSPATEYIAARVRATVSVPLYFIPAVAAQSEGGVTAVAIGGQTPKTSFKQGIFPFSPFGHLFEIGSAGAPACGATPAPGCRDGVSGLIVGDQYTLRWPSNPSLGNAQGNGSNMCAGDRVSGQNMINIANSAGGSERGFIEEGAASVLRNTIVNDYQTVTHEIGDLVTMTDGAIQTVLDALQQRIEQDLNTTATNSTQYFSGPHNNRRVVACLINDGVVQNGNQFRAIQIGAFLLLPGTTYGNGGNQSWCAEYLGPYCLGCNGRAAGSSGAYVVRLLQ